MTGPEMLLKSLGIDAGAIKAQVESFQKTLVGALKHFVSEFEAIKKAVGTNRETLERMERSLDRYETLLNKIAANAVVESKVENGITKVTDGTDAECGGILTTVSTAYVNGASVDTGGKSLSA